MQGKDKVVVNKNTDNKENNRPIYPPYFAKRKAKMNKELIKILEETATSEVVASDKYGEYRVGVFLHGCCVVTICYEDGVWSCQIYSDNPITLPIIQQIRYKFLPDALVMAQLFTSREVNRLQKSVVLYEIPAEMFGSGESEDKEVLK